MYLLLETMKIIYKQLLKNKNNTIHSNLKVFRKLFNDAIREDIIEPKSKPFSKFQTILGKYKQRIFNR